MGLRRDRHGSKIMWLYTQRHKYAFLYLLPGRLFCRVLALTSVCIALVSCGEGAPPPCKEKPRVSVSLAPYRYFVQRIAGSAVEVDVLIPSGADPHHYEATPRQMEALRDSVLWLRIGEPFEGRLASSLEGSATEVADLRMAWHHRHPVEHQHGGHCHCHLEDRHFWMSPKRAQEQAAFIAEALAQRLPEYRSRFQRRLRTFQQELCALTEELATTLAPVEGGAILVSHPALGYFCEDFGLQQISLEVEGREATPQQLAHILREAQQKKVSAVFTQAQHHPQGAEWMGKHLEVPVYRIDPYSEDYPAMLRSVAARCCQAAGVSGAPFCGSCHGE